MRILYVVPFVPRRSAAHGGRVMVATMERMATIHDIGIIYLRREDEPRIEGPLADACAWVEEVVLPRRSGGAVSELVRRTRLLVQLLRGLPMRVVDIDTKDFRAAFEQAETSFRPDVVQFELTTSARYLPSRRSNGRAAMVLVAYDVEAETAREARDASTGLERVARTLDAAAWRRFERRALRSVDAVVALTARDAAVLRSVDPRPSFSVIPLPCSPSERLSSPPTDSSHPTILFVGGFGHPPNVDAAQRLASVVFPRIRERVVGAQLVLVGAEPPARILELVAPDIRVVADAPRVEPYLDDAAVVVAPLRMGGGMRVKVLDALAAGKAVVASQRAVAGLDVVDGEHLRIADEDDEIVEAVAELLRDEARRRALGEGARRYAAEHGDVDAHARAYGQLYRELTGVDE